VAAGLHGLGEAGTGLWNGVGPGEADGVEAFQPRLRRDGGPERGGVTQKSRSA
jgi:hypothetical protein